jgi:hypothetical protein
MRGNGKFDFIHRSLFWYLFKVYYFNDDMMEFAKDIIKDIVLLNELNKIKEKGFINIRFC